MSPLIKGEGEGGGHGAGGEGGEEGDGNEFLLDGGRAFDDNGKATADVDGEKAGNEGSGSGSNGSERNGSSEGNSSDFELIKAGSSTSLSTAGEDPSAAVSQGAAAAVASTSIDQLTSGTTEGSG